MTTLAPRARIAVSVLFIVNGLSLSVWVPRLADIQRSLDISDFALGTALAAGAAGGLLLGPLAGWASDRWGSGRVAVVALMLFAPATMLIALAPGPWFLGGVLAWIGGMDAIMDAAMNAHALRVQTLYSRSIINGFHGFWSLGTVIGGGIGALSMAWGIALFPTLAAVAALCVIATVASAPWLLPGPDPHSHLDNDPSEIDVPSLADPGSVAPTKKIALTSMTALLGLFTLLAVIVESIPPQWSSIYLTSIDSPTAYVGLGYVAFTIAMTIGRFVGDRLVDRFTEVRVVRVGMVTSAGALAAALFVGNIWAFIAASMVTGFSVATLFPAAMRAAAHLPGITPAQGVSAVSWLSRAGFIAAPIVVGAVADSAGAGWGISTAVIAALALVPLARILRVRG